MSDTTPNDSLKNDNDTIKDQLQSLEKNKQTYVYKGEEFYKSGRHAVKKGTRSKKVQYEMVMVSNPEIKRWVMDDDLYIVHGDSND